MGGGSGGGSDPRPAQSGWMPGEILLEGRSALAARWGAAPVVIVLAWQPHA